MDSRRCCGTGTVRASSQIPLSQRLPVWMTPVPEARHGPAYLSRLRWFRLEPRARLPALRLPHGDRQRRGDRPARQHPAAPDADEGARDHPDAERRSQGREAWSERSRAQSHPAGREPSARSHHPRRHEHPAPPRAVTVGRVRANVLVDHPDVDSTHCRVAPEPEGWQVTNLGEKGLFRHGVRVDSTLLKPGEVVDLGGFPRRRRPRLPVHPRRAGATCISQAERHHRARCCCSSCR